jgi:hypothetical protein
LRCSSDRSSQPPRPDRRRALALLLAAVAAGGGARAQGLNEARVKARLALSLARFTQWPAGTFAAPDEPLGVCVVERSDALATAFRELSDQTVGGHPVRLIAPPPLGMAGCHLLFVHASAGPAGSAVLEALAGRPVLTVGDADGFVDRRGMVELVNVNDAIRMDVNLASIRSVKLELSSRVLQLARRVKE